MNQSGRYLLDTNIAIALFAGNPIVQEKVRDSDYVAVAPPNIGELCFGHKNPIKCRRIYRKLTF